MLIDRTDLRNIAIIAHVDHGKTTLVDSMLKQAHVFRENQQVIERIMDSDVLERERGITILAKNTSVMIWDPVLQQKVKINIVDTPGHSAFAGEVERVMNMVDGVLLLVDAAEGPMPQTRFVLKKALELGHRTIVVINKLDRKDAEPERVLNQTFDLFVELGASDEQADFPVIYANAITGQSGPTITGGPNLQPLFTAILRYIPCPRVDLEAPFQLLVANRGYSNFRGVTATGRISCGRLVAGQTVARITLDSGVLPEQARYLYTYEGLEVTEVSDAQAGEIVLIAGLEDIVIGETLADPDRPVALSPIYIEEPTVRMTFEVNTSPFAGKEGRWGTSRKLRERLFDELNHDVALRVDETDRPSAFLVSGRGELHLVILIEKMRREGYEFQASRPEVILRKGEHGEVLEPYEEVYIETGPDTVGAVVEMLAGRRGQMLDMSIQETKANLSYRVPVRGLLGFRYQFMTATRGLGVLYTNYYGYLPQTGAIASRQTGSLVASEAGVTTLFGLKNTHAHGTLFLTPGIAVYEGMVVGERQRSEDLAVNPCKKRHLTNMRSSVREIDVHLPPPRQMSLDEAIEYLADDELLEVTPSSYRIRKRTLETKERGKQVSRSKESFREQPRET